MFDFVDRELVRLEDGESFVELRRFVFGEDPDDTTLLALMLRSSAYADDYLGLGQGLRHCPGIHAKYHLDRIQVDCFSPVSPDQAQRTVVSWAVEVDGAPDLPVEDSLRTLRASVLPIFDSFDTLYELPNLGEDAHHDYGYILGAGGVFEFVGINRADKQLVSILAADD